MNQCLIVIKLLIMAHTSIYIFSISDRLSQSSGIGPQWISPSPRLPSRGSSIDSSVYKHDIVPVTSTPQYSSLPNQVDGVYNAETSQRWNFISFVGFIYRLQLMYSGRRH